MAVMSRRRFLVATRRPPPPVTTHISSAGLGCVFADGDAGAAPAMSRDAAAPMRDSQVRRVALASSTCFAARLIRLSR